jgi:two-component system alkaline phosphatase synthesis response regulator PhoP
MIFCVEDDDSIRELVVYTLESTGFTARGFENGQAFEQGVRNEIPDLVLMDIMLPGEDGISLLRKMRADPKRAKIPVIMLTAKGAEYDKVMALDLGADDYITKPFGMMELVSRIRAVLRRSEKRDNAEGQVISLRNLRLDLKKHEVTVDGKGVVLTLKEYSLLKILMENPGIVLTRDQLLTDIWGYEYISETRTVDVHIRTLRQKLETAGDLIQTVRGVGYKLAEG